MPKPGKPRRSQRKHPHTARAGRREKKSSLPSVAVVVVREVDAETGEISATPARWEEDRAAPHIAVFAARGPAPAIGDRVLARLQPAGKNRYEGEIIRVLGPEESRDAPRGVLGIFTITTGGGGIIEPVNRRERESFRVEAGDTLGAREGDLVAATLIPEPIRRMQMPRAKIEEKLGALTSARAASLIAIHANKLRTHFPDAALREAEEAAERIPVLLLEEGRADLRALPLVTIDGEDARDFDDAVFAEPDPRNEGGWHIVVAIADVAHYVKPHSALDAEALARGNSAYFPDRVLPMLPEALSNGICSLKPEEDRYCLAVHLWIDAEGQTKSYRFERAVMRSRARLTYVRAQALSDAGDEAVSAIYGAYRALSVAAAKREGLALSLPEYSIMLDERGEVKNIAPKARLESHQLIEAYMVAANVAAADFLIKNKAHGIFRVHDAPDALKLEDLRALLSHMGYRLPQTGGIKPAHLNAVLKRAAGKADEVIVHQSVLRAQMQAYYAPANAGHFGLGLTRYTHFTSPIRRYSDLVVHRSITALLEGGPAIEGGKNLAATADHISQTERAAMQAERDATDRYRAAFMEQKTGGHFSGVITGMSEAGLFITLPETGVTGFLPMRALGQDFFRVNRARGEMTGRSSGKTYALGARLGIVVQEASRITGSLLFSLPGGGLTEPSRGNKMGRRKRKS